MENNTNCFTSTQNINLIPTDLRMPRTLSHPEHTYVYEMGLMLSNVGRSYTPEDNEEFARLENRLNRYDRLEDLGAPVQVIDKEAELIFRSTLEVYRKIKKVAGDDWVLDDMRMPLVYIMDDTKNFIYQESIRFVNCAKILRLDEISVIEELDDAIEMLELVLQVDWASEEDKVDAFNMLKKAYKKLSTYKKGIIV